MKRSIMTAGLLSVIAALLLSGCAATQVAISKRNLDVQTKESASLFLDPVPNKQKVVYVQVKNTSDKPQFQVTSQIAGQLIAKGYKVTNNLDEAHYLLQANILQVGKTSPSANEMALKGGYGGALGGALAGAATTAVFSNSGTAVLAGGLIGGAASLIADSAVKDVTFSAITDVQISERTNAVIKEKTQSDLAQGTSTKTVQTSSKQSHWQRYRTRIVSTAEKVSLDFDTALPELEKGLTNAIAGIF